MEDDLGGIAGGSRRGMILGGATGSMRDMILVGEVGSEWGITGVSWRGATFVRDSGSGANIAVSKDADERGGVGGGENGSGAKIWVIIESVVSWEERLDWNDGVLVSMRGRGCGEEVEAGVAPAVCGRWVEEDALAV